MKLSELDPSFMLAMALEMYRFEASLVNTMELLTDSEIRCFYSAYMGYPQ